MSAPSLVHGRGEWRALAQRLGDSPDARSVDVRHVGQCYHPPGGGACGAHSAARLAPIPSSALLHTVMVVPSLCSNWPSGEWRALTTTTMGPKGLAQTCALATAMGVPSASDKAVCLRRNGAICLRQAGYRRFRIGLAGLICGAAVHVSGQGAPNAIHCLNAATNCSWLSGGSVRPGPGFQPQATSLS